MDEARASRPLVGLIVNPIAGLGGRVGLKGTDGPGMASRAMALGARPMAGHRTTEALAALLEAWPARAPAPRVITVAGAMGADATTAAGLLPELLGARPTAGRGPTAPGAALVAGAPDDPGHAADLEVVTSREDTRWAAREMRDLGVDLLVFSGGDGTARDILDAVGATIVALGIPAGAKVQSAVFATAPRTAGRLAAAHLLAAAAGRRLTTEERDVVDLDEDAYRAGRVAPRLYGVLRVPAGRTLQSRKAPTPPSDAIALEQIAVEVAASLVAGRSYVLGPGSTVAAVARALGLPKTLVGVDVAAFEAGASGEPRAWITAMDAGEDEVRAAVGDQPVSIIVTPVGGQGFLFGRGNQPIGTDVIRRAGRDGLIVVASQAKIASLGGRPLLVDTGDPALDAELAGFVPVITGYRERTVVPVAAA
jgi:predicted polyphosphate/ATP-dependent NAD kinase